MAALGFAPDLSTEQGLNHSEEAQAGFQDFPQSRSHLSISYFNRSRMEFFHSGFPPALYKLVACPVSGLVQQKWGAAGQPGSGKCSFSPDRRQTLTDAESGYWRPKKTPTHLTGADSPACFSTLSFHSREAVPVPGFGHLLPLPSRTLAAALIQDTPGWAIPGCQHPQSCPDGTFCQGSASATGFSHTAS